MDVKGVVDPSDQENIGSILGNALVQLGLLIVDCKGTQKGLVIGNTRDGDISTFSRFFQAMSKMVAAGASGMAAVSILAVSRMTF